MFDFIPNEQLNFSSPKIVQEIAIAHHENDAWVPLLNTIATEHLSTMSDEELDRDWKLGEFFGTIAVINLPKATERLNSIKNELNSIGTDSFEKFQAIDGRNDVKPAIWQKFMRERVRGKTIPRINGLLQRQFWGIFQGEAGCYLSHFQLIKKIKNAFENSLQVLNTAQMQDDTELIKIAQNDVRKYSRLLILEDDGGFGFVASDKKTVIKQGVGRHLREALQELPTDWDMLYLVVHATEPTEKTSTHLRKIKNAWCCVAYAINYTMYEILVDYLKKIENPSIKNVFPIDNELGKIHQFYNVYAIYPSIAYQHAGTSSISASSNQNLWQGQPIKKNRKTTLYSNHNRD